MMKKLIFSLLLLTAAHLGAQDTGSIAGTITDKELNNEPLPFANVLIQGTTKGTTSDFDGLYEIANLEPGTYVVIYSFLGYETVTIPDVTVEAGKVSTIDIPMAANAGVELEGVTVTTVARKDSEVALLLDQKKAIEIKESIGAQQLGKIGVSDVATATTKISGVSSSEASGDVFVRGLGDRYLSTTLNGLAVPSDDVEKKNIDLGLFPTRVIQNVSVSKTYASQNTADQASGTINILSRELSGSEELSFGVQTGVNSNVAQDGVFDNFKSSPNANNSNFGFYAQDRTTQQAITQQGWNTVKRDNPIDYAFNFVAGKKVTERLSVLVTGSHNTSHEYGQGVFRQYRSNFVDDTITDATNFRRNQVTSGLLDLTFFANEKNKLKSSTFFVNKLTDQVYEGGRNGEGTIFEESDPAEGLFQFIRDQNTKQTRLLVTQLLGNHTLGERNILSWAGGYNLVNADEPNRIRNEVNFDPDGNFVQLGRTGGFQQRKSSQEIDDTEFNGYVNDVLTILDEEEKAFKVELGINYRNKQRDFRSEFVGVEERATNVINPPSIDNIGSIFQQGNFDNGLLELNILQPDLYDGKLISQAAYVDFNYGFKKWNFDAGLRYQSDEINVGFDVGNFPGRIGETIKEYSNLYPSVNVKYDLNDKHGLRLAVSSTITLPEFKEIAPFEYVSQTGQITRGNPDLEASRNLNYDLKWEYFPSNGQLVSLAAFYKEISDPINKVQDRGSAGIFSYFNSGEKAEVYGLEAEGKIDLINPVMNDEDGSSSGYGLNLSANITRMWHTQDLKEVRDENGNFVRTFRYKGLTKTDLQGASDWIVNASLNFNTAGENAFSASLTANYASDKIFALGAPEIQSQSETFYNDAIIEKGFVALDAVLSKEIGAHWRVRLIGRNLLNPEIRRTQLVRPSTTDIETDRTVRSYTAGAQVRLGINYTF
ncbi:TonB-dependent receptor [Aggregatimonas sangjinii]|uniref:TonB-dependent receptor n=2 Tax=Aggregatimonas sangjinii TaxID=2583587 RepID=A0A5B7SZA5_9FLAO|nr:TonB-dependent receptor [Aggregatimonas sangjinii]